MTWNDNSDDERYNNFMISNMSRLAAKADEMNNKRKLYLAKEDPMFHLEINKQFKKALDSYVLNEICSLSNINADKAMQLIEQTNTPLYLLGEEI